MASNQPLRSSTDHFLLFSSALKTEIKNELRQEFSEPLAQIQILLQDANEYTSNAKVLNEDSKKTNVEVHAALTRLERLVERLGITQSKCKFNLFLPGLPYPCHMRTEVIGEVWPVIWVAFEDGSMNMAYRDARALQMLLHPIVHCSSKIETYSKALAVGPLVISLPRFTALIQLFSGYIPRGASSSTPLLLHSDTSWIPRYWYSGEVMHVKRSLKVGAVNADKALDEPMHAGSRQSVFDSKQNVGTCI